MSLLNHVRRAAMLTGAAMVFVAAQVSRLGAFAAQQDGFVPASSLPQTQSVSAPALVLTAYGFVWLLVVIFVFMMWRKLSTLEKELVDARREFSARKSSR